jgi:hypothetical protein
VWLSIPEIQNGACPKGNSLSRSDAVVFYALSSASRHCEVRLKNGTLELVSKGNGLNQTTGVYLNEI